MLRTYEESEAAAHMCSVKKLFIKVSWNSQEETCATVFF